MPELTPDAQGIIDSLEEEVTEPVAECPECGTTFEGPYREENAAECCRIFECDHCGTQYHDEDSAYDCCRYHCSSCGSEHRSDEESYDCCRAFCPECGESYSYDEDAQNCCRSSEFHGDLPVLPEVEPYRLVVADLPGRPVRLCSIEQELEKGGNIVAKLLYEIGLADRDTIHNYHSSASRPGMAHVEEDGSLPRDGGEVIFDRFNLSQDGHIDRLSEALTKIRQLRDSGDRANRPVGTGFSAGIHVHISARSMNGTMFGPRDVAALYELWCYAEDMLYSLSASGWNRHRQPSDAYSGYCKPVPKGNQSSGTSSRDVWNLMRSDRYYGLNFQRLFQAVERCSCGAARMGDWQSCDCGGFDRGTIEWRVFNSSTLPRTIHAWLLFAHAMTAYAADHQIGTLTSNPYGTTTTAEKRQVLEDLLARLPLTDGERDVIREAADRSPGL